MGTRHPLDLSAYLLMVVFCLVLGFQQIAIKLAAQDIAPVLQIALRSGLAAVLVTLYMLWRGERVTLSNGLWRPAILVGILFSLEYLMLGEALRFTTASHAVVFLYMAPIFAGLLLHFLVPAERMSVIQWLGIMLSFCGVATAFLIRGDAAALSSQALFGDLLALLGAMAWGATTVVLRTSRLAAVSATQTLLYQLVGAFVFLLVSAVLLGQTAINPTLVALGSLGFQAIIVSFAGFLIWFWLLRHYLASQLGALSFMTPLFGVVLGAWLLHEPIEPGFLLGALMVIFGIILFSAQGLIGRWLGVSVK